MTLIYKRVDDVKQCKHDHCFGFVVTAAGKQLYEMRSGSIVFSSSASVDTAPSVNAFHESLSMTSLAIDYSSFTGNTNTSPSLTDAMSRLSWRHIVTLAKWGSVEVFARLEQINIEIKSESNQYALTCHCNKHAPVHHCSNSVSKTIRKSNSPWMQ
jgi:hypothetical protein